jgi:hypothetical protein
MGSILKYSRGISKMDAVGLYRCPGNPPFACILDKANCNYMAQDAYRAGGIKPDFDALPWEADYRAAKQNSRKA